MPRSGELRGCSVSSRRIRQSASGLIELRTFPQPEKDRMAPELARALKESETYGALSYAMSSIGNLALPAVEELNRAPDPQTRWHTFEVIYDTKLDARIEARATLLRGLDDEDLKVRVKAASALGGSATSCFRRPGSWPTS